MSYTPVATQSGDWTILHTICWRTADSELGILGFEEAQPNTLSISYSESREEYRMLGDGIDLSFGPQDSPSQIPGGYTSYNRSVAGGLLDNFLITLAPLDRNDTLVAEYFGYFTTNINSLAGLLRSYGCQFGMPTQTGDFADQTLTYSNQSIFGTASRDGPGTGAGAYSISDTVAEMTFDPVRGEVDIILDIAANRGSGNTIELGEYSGSLSVNQDTGQFEGSLQSTLVLNSTSQVSGYLYGPKSSEAAMTFAVTGTQSADITFRFFGQSFLNAD
ncbi:hypothetical protein [Erythrobacter sp. F6033]|uniref:hypothetical protein n=1 Tax=Erythrobacter sp. F6033 TaxID=2926401 RepID=UPI001FF3376D|nr:hypothetical protein [Erythrobacter sp. F6033]MCK0128633.1 hypothetical protein [Erythrobacter sp. F6033]